MKNKRRCWLVFDLGLRGNYERLYAWLDKMQAEECGDSVATFITEKTRAEIKEELSKFLDKNARIYFIESQGGIVRNKEVGRGIGGFIKGGRITSPWAGYGKEQIEVEEE